MNQNKNDDLPYSFFNVLRPEVTGMYGRKPSGPAIFSCGASYLWDPDWAITADQNGSHVTAQFHPVKHGKKLQPPPQHRTLSSDERAELEMGWRELEVA